MTGPLEDDLEFAIDQFQGLAPEIGEISDSITKKDVYRVLARLNRIYWKRVDEAIRRAVAAGGDDLVFDDRTRLLVDVGLLDLRLLRSVTKETLSLLLDEIGLAEAHCLYLHQWLARQYRSRVLLNQVADVELKIGQLEDSLKEKEDFAQKLLYARMRLYQQLQPEMAKVPGVTPQIVDMICSGRLDATIDQDASPRQEGDGLAFKLTLLRNQVLGRLKSHLKDEALLKQLDYLVKIINQSEVERQKKASLAGTLRTTVDTKRERERRLAVESRAEFLVGEVRLVKSLMQLGTTDAGIRRTHSLLLEADGRLQRRAVLEVLDLIRDCDPHLPIDKVTFLIAPFTGTGFYEWDRDTIVLPLSCIRSHAESILTGIANYRILLDTNKDNRRLMNAYERELGMASSRNRFIVDYRKWVLGIGKGYRGALDGRTYEFFRNHIGPNPDRIIAPRELLRLSTRETLEVIKRSRKRINSGEGTFDDFYRMAVAYWKRNQIFEAYSNMEMAVKKAPMDGRSRFSLAVLAHRMDLAQTRHHFRSCVSGAPNSIWSVYANDYLSKM